MPRNSSLPLALVAAMVALSGCPDSDQADDDVTQDDDAVADDDTAGDDDDTTAGDDDTTADDDDYVPPDDFSGDWDYFYLPIGNYWLHNTEGEFRGIEILDQRPQIDFDMDTHEDPIPLTGTLDTDDQFALSCDATLDQTDYHVTLDGWFRSLYTFHGEGYYDPPEGSDAWVSYAVYGVRSDAPPAPIAFDGDWDVTVTETFDGCDYSYDTFEEVWHIASREHWMFTIDASDELRIPYLVGVLHDDESSFDLGAQIVFEGDYWSAIHADGHFDSPDHFVASGTYILVMCQVDLEIEGSRR
jgi:hypothetical protein